MNKNNELSNLCACGCGMTAKPGRKFVHGHNNRGKPSPLKTTPSSPPPLCKCGCGEPVLWSESRRRWNKYLRGHEHRGRKHSPEALAKMREKAKARANHVAKMNKQRVWTAESRKKLSDAKKRNPLPQRFNCGEDNICFKHGRPYPRAASSVLRRIREDIILERGFKCELCGAIPEKRKLLHMHHIDENPLNNSVDNLMLLCVTCHNKITHNY